MTAEQKKVLQRVDARLAELHLRWSDLIVRLNESKQRLNNWRKRGVPPAMHERMAAALDWTVDELLGRAVVVRMPSQWPFQKVSASRFFALTEGEQMHIEGMVVDEMNKIERSKAASRKRARG